MQGRTGAVSLLNVSVLVRLCTETADNLVVGWSAREWQKGEVISPKKISLDIFFAVAFPFWRVRCQLNKRFYTPKIQYTVLLELYFYNIPMQDFS